MAIEQINLDLIEDNPYQSRLTYHKQDIDDLAASIKAHGLLQVPPARRKNGNVQLGFGHLRKRAFLKLAKEDPRWSKMPLDIRDLTDEQMALFSLEENIKRRDITPIEVARAVDKYLGRFTDKTETDLAKLLNMTQGNISHMRRVLRLPNEVLQKIDEGRISFTMARELLVFQDLVVDQTEIWNRKENRYVKVPKDGKFLMLEAIRGLRTEGRPYGEPNTVEGIQRATHRVAKSHLRALEKEQAWYSSDPLFDTRAAGCLECNQMIRTHPTKSQTAHWCTNKECWDQKQQEHKDRVAAEARAKMQADVLRKVVEVEEKREAAQDITQVITKAEEPSEGLLTPQEAEIFEEAIVSEDEEEHARIETLKHLPEDLPCHGCLNVKTCDRTNVYAAEDGKLTCDSRLTKETIPELRQRATMEIPEALRPVIEEKAGTRAQVLDLNELWLDSWGHELKQGYALLSNDLNRVDDPEECVERCMQGFHYAFDSRRTTGEVMYVCTNPKCLSKKKSAFTRAKNAQGQAKKNAERVAIKQAVEQTTVIDRPRIKLILLAQFEGSHTERYGYGNRKSPKEWLWDKLSAGTSGIERNNEKLFRHIDKLSDEELSRLTVEFMLAMLTYTGDVENYRINTTEALKWMGIGVNVGVKGGNHD